MPTLTSNQLILGCSKGRRDDFMSVGTEYIKPATSSIGFGAFFRLPDCWIVWIAELPGL